MIAPFGGTAAPTGWLLCDGSTLLQSSYSDLYAAIGTRYGGSGASFVLPDLRNRVPRGASSASATVTTAGADTVTIASDNIPSHTHSIGSLAVATHTDHVHLHNGDSALAAQVSLAHTHSTPDHDHVITTTGAANSGRNGVKGLSSGTALLGPTNSAYDTTYIGSLVSAGNANASSAGVVEVQAGLSNSSNNVNYLRAEITNSGGSTTGAMSANASHTHALTGSTAGVTAPALTHTVSGSTGTNTTNGTALDIKPSYQTVNYIIKT
jgi:microcystin-dependent protein